MKYKYISSQLLSTLCVTCLMKHPDGYYSFTQKNGLKCNIDIQEKNKIYRHIYIHIYIHNISANFSAQTCYLNLEQSWPCRFKADDYKMSFCASKEYVVVSWCFKCIIMKILWHYIATRCPCPVSQTPTGTGSNITLKYSKTVRETFGIFCVKNVPFGVNDSLFSCTF